MTIQKITIDSRVKHIPQSEQVQSDSRERDSKLNKVYDNSFPHKQNKKLSQNNKKFIAKISAQDIKIKTR